jgi:hypothetical protein
MADWNDLRRYIKSTYKIAEDNINSMTLLFNVDDNRSQAVMVSSIDNSGWASISTAVCTEHDIDARQALARNSTMIVGGLALLDDGTVIFRLSFPLGNLDPDEFEEPLHVAVGFGDRLERELTGGSDRF